MVSVLYMREFLVPTILLPSAAVHTRGGGFPAVIYSKNPFNIHCQLQNLKINDIMYVRGTEGSFRDDRVDRYVSFSHILTIFPLPLTERGHKMHSLVPYKAGSNCKQ